jgi:hypothetical protein
MHYLPLTKVCFRYRAQEYRLRSPPADPFITGLGPAARDAIGDVVSGATAGPREAYRQAKLMNEPSSKCHGIEVAPVGSYKAVATSTAKGIGEIITAGLKTPATFTNGLARGFHNAPKLYGDDTVKEQDEITGLKSGFVAAGKVCPVLLSHPSSSLLAE